MGKLCYLTTGGKSDVQHVLCSSEDRMYYEVGTIIFSHFIEKKIEAK